MEKDNTMLLLWGGIAFSPLGWLYIGVRFMLAFLVTTLLVIWDLVTTIFTIIWKILTDLWPFLIIVGVIFLVLLLIHIYWSEFVDFLNNVFLPILQIIIDDFLRFIWNDLFIPLWNILVQLWNSMVQIIGFFMYVISFSFSSIFAQSFPSFLCPPASSSFPSAASRTTSQPSPRRSGLVYASGIFACATPRAQ